MVVLNFDLGRKLINFYVTYHINIFGPVIEKKSGKNIVLKQCAENGCRKMTYFRVIKNSSRRLETDC